MNKELAIDGRSSRAVKQREKRKLQILQAAEQVIGQKGFHGASIDDVIAASGISRGTFYLYFDSREVLFQELLDGFIHKLLGVIQPVRLEDATGHLEKLYFNFVQVISLLFAHKNLTIILLREALVHGGPVQEKLSELDDFLQRMFTGALRNGAILGLTRKVNEKLVAVAIIGSIKEIITHYLMKPENPQPSPEAISKEILEFLFRGLAPH